MNHLSKTPTGSVRPTPQPNSKRLGRTLVGFALVVALVIFIQPIRVPVSAGTATAQTSSQLESKWRYTRYGWQDPADWLRTPSHVQERFVDRLDPVLLSIDIFLAVLGATIWASEEWQVARLLGRDTE